MDRNGNNVTSMNQRLKDIRSILIKQGLLDPEEELTEAMLEDLVHFAYFTGCISKKEVKRLLNLDDHQTRKKIQEWKRWQEGNRSCNLRENPFYEGWKIVQTEKTDNR